MDQGQEQVLELLRASFEWARGGDVRQLAYLLDLGASPDLTNDRGDTLLILAAYHQQHEAVRLLIDRGADVERANDNGQTALGGGARSARSVAQFFDLPDMLALLPAART